MGRLRNAGPRVVLPTLVTLSVMGIFVLPFFVPASRLATNSASQLVGFNNRAAACSAAVIGMAVYVFARQRIRARGLAIFPDERARLGWPLVAAVVLVSGLFFAAAAWAVTGSGLRYLSDAGYFIEQARAHADDGRALYSQLEFAYGPLLFYPVVWAHGLLHCSWNSAYFVALAFSQILGTVLFALYLDRLPISIHLRRFGFLLCSLGALSPLLGLNYTLFRFVTPLLLLLVSTQTRSRRITAYCWTLGVLVVLSISAEQAITFVWGCVVYAALNDPLRRGRWLVSLVFCQLIEVLLFLFAIGPGYLEFFHLSALGALNLPVMPYPHILIFLAAAVWLVPWMLGSHSYLDPEQGRSLAAQYAMATALLPAVLGRCDPLHVFFNGIGMICLSLVTIGRTRTALRVAWIVCLLIFVGYQQWVNQRLYFGRTIDTLRLAVMPRLSAAHRNAVLGALTRAPELSEGLQPAGADDDELYPLNTVALQHYVGRETVATPFEVSPAVEQALREAGLYRSSRYAFMFNVLDPEAERQKIVELRQGHWALLPRTLETGFVETPADIGNLQGFAFPLRARYPVSYAPRAALIAEMEKNWMPVCDLGPYTLYTQLSKATGEPDTRVGACR